MNDFLDSALLRCFLAVLERRTLTVAADHLCVTQSALSKSLRRLEEDLGVPLFQRTPGGMVPTTYGLALSRRAHMINMESRSARAELQVLREGGVGSLTVGAGPLWSVHLLPTVISQMKRRNANLHFKVVSGVLSNLLPQLLKGEIDVVCAALDFPDHPELIKKKILVSEHVVVAHKSHPLAKMKHVDAQTLVEYPFVGIADDYAGIERMEKYFALHGLVPPRLAVETTSIEMLLSILATGDFVSSLSSQLLVRGKSLGLQALPVSESFWTFDAGVVYRRTPHASALIDMLQHELTSHAGSATATSA